MLDPDSWLHKARALPIGGRDRVEHDCGEGTPLMINHEIGGYTAYCFRCNEPGFRSKQATLAELLELQRRRTTGDFGIARQVSPPGPANTDVDSWPVEARLWLYKAGIGKPEIRQLGFYFHDESQRVVLPIIQGGGVSYWQARAVMKGHQPKYLNDPTGKDGVLARYGDADVIVLTEDILSAAKVGLVVEGWAMLGTKLSTTMTAALVRAGKPVLVWLDPDSAGVRGAAKIMSSLRSMGIRVANIESSRDPKLHSRKQIAELTGSLMGKLRRES